MSNQHQSEVWEWLEPCPEFTDATFQKALDSFATALNQPNSSVGGSQTSSASLSGRQHSTAGATRPDGHPMQLQRDAGAGSFPSNPARTTSNVHSRRPQTAPNCRPQLQRQRSLPSLRASHIASPPSSSETNNTAHSDPWHISCTMQSPEMFAGSEQHSLVEWVAKHPGRRQLARTLGLLDCEGVPDVDIVNTRSAAGTRPSGSANASPTGPTVVRMMSMSTMQPQDSGFGQLPYAGRISKRTRDGEASLRQLPTPFQPAPAAALSGGGGLPSRYVPAGVSAQPPRQPTSRMPALEMRDTGMCSQPDTSDYRSSLDAIHADTCVAVMDPWDMWDNSATLTAPGHASGLNAATAQQQQRQQQRQPQLEQQQQVQYDVRPAVHDVPMAVAHVQPAIRLQQQMPAAHHLEEAGGQQALQSVALTALGHMPMHRLVASSQGQPQPSFPMEFFESSSAAIAPQSPSYLHSHPRQRLATLHQATPSQQLMRSQPVQRAFELPVSIAHDLGSSHGVANPLGDAVDMIWAPSHSGQAFDPVSPLKRRRSLEEQAHLQGMAPVAQGPGSTYPVQLSPPQLQAPASQMQPVHQEGSMQYTPVKTQNQTAAAAALAAVEGGPRRGTSPFSRPGLSPDISNLSSVAEQSVVALDGRGRRQYQKVSSFGSVQGDDHSSQVHFLLPLELDDLPPMDGQQASELDVDVCVSEALAVGGLDDPFRELFEGI